MPCYYPVNCYRFSVPNQRGTRPLLHTLKSAEASGELFEPAVRCCGMCRGCRLEVARQKAMRCVLESSRYERNCWLTLTYDDDHLPKDNSINYDDVKNFWKRFRDRKGYPKIKYFVAGEYGEKRSRPHYHACLFNWDFDDKKYLKESYGGDDLFTSRDLESIWQNGDCYLGAITFESAAYTARYTMDKRVGPDAEAFYRRLGVRPETSWTSKGLGKTWLDEFCSDIYPKDFVTMRGVKLRPPAYFDKLLMRIDPDLMGVVKRQREEFLKLNNSKINFELRDVYVSKDVFSFSGEKMFSLYGPVPTAVSDIVHEASMRVGSVDNER